MTGTHLDHGTWVVLATPFDEDGGLDETSLRREVGAFADLDVAGFVALGVFGEAASLDDSERAAVVRAVMDETDRSVVVGLPGLTRADVLHDTDVVMSAAPRAPRALMVQIHDTDVDTVVAQQLAVHEASATPLVVQDYPVASGVRVDLEAVVRVIEGLGDVAAAAKAECPPTSAAIAELASRVTCPIFGGLGGVGLLDELAAGAAGAMTGFSHPEAIAATVAAHFTGGTDAAQQVWAPWLPLANFEGQVGIGLAIRKEILHRRGILRTAVVRPPARTLPARLSPLVTRHLAATDQLRSTASWISN